MKTWKLGVMLVRERYNVLTFDRSGVTRVYATR